MPVCGSGGLVSSSSLLIRRQNMPAVRPRFHLTPCSKFRGHLTLYPCKITGKKICVQLKSLCPPTRAYKAVVNTVLGLRDMTEFMGAYRNNSDLWMLGA